jgi:hypothetical protein
MNAALGGVSAGGPGSPLSEVTQRGGGPRAFVANHSAGNSGGVTLSKFSVDITRGKQDGHLPRLCASRGPTASPAAMINTKQRTFRNRFSVNVCFTFLIIASAVQPTLLPNRADARQSDFPELASAFRNKMRHSRCPTIRKKRVCPSAVELFVGPSFCRREARHRHELRAKLRPESTSVSASSAITGLGEVPALAETAVSGEAWVCTAGKLDTK